AVHADGVQDGDDVGLVDDVAVLQARDVGPGPPDSLAELVRGQARPGSQRPYRGGQAQPTHVGADHPLPPTARRLTMTECCTGLRNVPIIGWHTDDHKW